MRACIHNVVVNMGLLKAGSQLLWHGLLQGPERGSEWVRQRGGLHRGKTGPSGGCTFQIAV